MGVKGVPVDISNSSSDDLAKMAISNLVTYYYIEHRFRGANGVFLSHIKVKERMQKKLTARQESIKSELDNLATELRWVFKAEDVDIFSMPDPRELLKIGEKVEKFNDMCMKFSE